jgi:large subunit ribosomal protein L28
LKNRVACAAIIALTITIGSVDMKRGVGVTADSHQEHFIFAIRSVTIKTSVFYPLKRRKCRVMALKCAICGKGPHYGNVVSHANNTRRRRWNPNLKRVRAVVDGVRKQVRVCTGCIRLGRVKKAA